VVARFGVNLERSTPRYPWAAGKCRQVTEQRWSMLRLLQHPGLASTNNSEWYGRYQRPLNCAEHLDETTLQDDSEPCWREIRRRVFGRRHAMVLVSTSKKNFQLKLKLALSAPVLALAPCFLFHASTAAADDSWQNLKHVTHERYYTVVDRKSSCLTGHIVKTNDHQLTLKLPKGTYAAFDRANVLRVSVSRAGTYLPPHAHADVGRAYDAIYNDKSSWSDLIGLAGQEVKVVKTGGETYEGKLLVTSEAQLELDRTGGTLEFAKRDIAQVYHLRPKPFDRQRKVQRSGRLLDRPTAVALLPQSRSEVACRLVRLVATGGQYAC
jgi:hypothetical protein